MSGWENAADSTRLRAATGTREAEDEDPVPSAKPAASVFNADPSTDSEALKVLVADQIQRLLSFYKQLNAKGEHGRNTCERKGTTGESCESGGTIGDKPSMERRKFSLNSNGMIAGGYEEKLLNAMIEGICDVRKSGENANA